MRFFESIYLALTPVQYTVCLIVLFYYVPAIWNRRVLTEVDWFIMGINLGWVGRLGESVFWNSAWTNHFLGGSMEIWINNAAIPNIIFRQVLPIISGLCHIIAAYKTGARIGWRTACGATAVALALFVGNLIWSILTVNV